MSRDDGSQKTVQDLPSAIIRWYSFRSGSKALFLGENNAVADMLRDVFKMQVICSDVFDISNIEGVYNYVICIGRLELDKHPVKILKKIRSLLSRDGIFLLGMNNRLGLRYFCGDHDPYTSRSFDGIEKYCRASNAAGCMYAKFEIEAMLSEAGWKRKKYYSVLPCLEDAAFLYAEGCLPKEDLGNRLFPNYNHPQALFLDEETLYQFLADNGMFHAMSNAYLVECSLEGSFSDACYVTTSLERGKENAMLTVVHSNGTVSKEAVYHEGQERLKRLEANMKALQRASIPIVEGHIDTKGRYVMPYIPEVTGQVYLKALLLKDKKKFIEAMDEFKDMILASSPIHMGEYTDARGNKIQTKLFDKAFLDMVPLNSFYLNGKFVLFDQEFSKKNYPVAVVLTRMIATFYAGEEGQKLEKVLPSSVLYNRYGLLENIDTWLEMEWVFLKKLRQINSLAEYSARVKRGTGTVKANRRRMNYPEQEYRRIFIDIFQNADTKKLILFGSGNYAHEFMNLYRVRYPVYAIVDNNEKVWGHEIHGVAIHPPELLAKLQHGEFKVLICIRQFYPVMEQLDSLGIEDYSIFDPGKSYAIPRLNSSATKPSKEKIDKEYHIGYVAGVFDLFHIGHLNILRRAKEHCDYLIVGVVSDRQVREYKKVEPFVPFAERLDMIRSCRYVDEAHEIPFEHPDTDMAWKLYHFDVQFSGSDYEHDPVWLKKKEWLEERGSTMVFFPYTQSTSSTRLKKLIEERLI